MDAKAEETWRANHRMYPPIIEQRVGGEWEPLIQVKVVAALNALQQQLANLKAERDRYRELGKLANSVVEVVRAVANGNRSIGVVYGKPWAKRWLTRYETIYADWPPGSPSPIAPEEANDA